MFDNEISIFKHFPNWNPIAIGGEIAFFSFAALFSSANKQPALVEKQYF